ncbi:phage tail protein, partial [Achromobacter denitrificans]
VDEVVLNFVNEDTWAMDEVRAKVPGALATNNPLQLDLDGVTSKDQAGREANLIAAAQTWKRRRITWETDVEGMISTRGDVVRFSHDLAEWGFAGRMLPGSGGVTIKLQNKVPSGGTGIALLRDPDGNMKTVSVVSAVGDVDELTITTGLDGFPMPGDEGFEDCSPFDWTWQFDPIATPGRRFKITGVKPAGDGLRFEAMDDDPEYYACENNPYQYTPPRDGALLAGVVLALTGTEQIISVSTDQIRFSLSWLLSSDTQSLVSILVNGLPRVSEVTASRMMDIMVATGDVIDVTITPRRGTGSGEPRRKSFVIQGLAAPLPAVTGLTSVFRDGLTVLSWLRVTDVREPWYEIRLGPTWANATVVAQTPALETLAVGNGLYHVAAAYRLADGTMVYGPADTLQIAGAVLVRNVILTRDEAPAWAGTAADGAIVYQEKLTLASMGDVLDVVDVFAEEDMLWLGGATARGVYTIAEPDRVDIGFVAAVRIGFDVDFDVWNANDDILAAADVLSLADVLDGSRLSQGSATLQVRSASADGEWTDWTDYVPGLINARYFDVRLVLETKDPHYIPFVNQFTWFIDVPDLIQRGEGLAVGAAAERVNFAKAFHAIPNVQITILDAQDADRAVLTDSDETGFTIAIMNGATHVARDINWLAQGY